MKEVASRFDVGIASVMPQANRNKPATKISTYWVVQDLIPKLPPSSVVVMDNATFHKGASIQKSLELHFRTRRLRNNASSGLTRGGQGEE